MVTPLKILEYSAARKPIISTPLKLLQETKCPHVIIPEHNPEAWFNAIQTLKTKTWESEWDKFIEGYDWGNIAKNLVKFISPASSTIYISQDTV